ncbi:MAG: hypothetical protein WBC90_10950 [Albidovulum sp.]
MNRLVTALTVVSLTLLLANCGKIRDSRINPFNWFGKSQSAATAAAVSPGEISDGRLLVREVTSFVVEKTPGGAILRATGLPPTQGWWNAELVAQNRGQPEDGVLTYRFLVFEPLGQTRVSTPQSREVTAAVFLSDIRMQEVSNIIVLAETNSRSSRR